MYYSVSISDFQGEMGFSFQLRDKKDAPWEAYYESTLPVFVAFTRYKCITKVQIGQALEVMWFTTRARVQQELKGAVF